ncbi:DEAD/DEAH box helicase [Leptolyngbya sp. FACHB-36]|uniref:helicase-related protein n=1 Tax=Leptolyngbya sp. FACHB-36 TaxID=2692808 RepID=UPI00168171F9|nr:DEAD/DEAH box helicase [Leptolyngbya sp. FACHB-36]MBD2019312.1 DEAD/DEAH box helicase [Leptolyngbya sp. FACHB-36]
MAGTIALKPKFKIRHGDCLRFEADQTVTILRGARTVHRCRYSQTLQKKAAKLPPNSRWITIHPHGEGKGVPILIQERPDGSAHVIGGAGGKLNYLRLRNLRSPEEWKQSARERAQKRKQKERERVEAQTETEREQEAGDKQQAKEYHTTEKHKNAATTLDALDRQGIEHGLTEAHRKALSQVPSDPEQVEQWKQLTREAVDRVKQIHRAYEHKLATDHEARAAARSGDVPLTGEAGNPLIEKKTHSACSDDGTELASLVQLPNGQWLSRSLDGGNVYDSWDAAAREHVRNVLEREQEHGGDRTQHDSFYDPSQWVKAASDERLPEGFEFKPEIATEIAHLSHERKTLDRNQKAAERAIERGQAWDALRGSVDVGPVEAVSNQAVLDQLESDAKTLEDAVTNSNFLALFDEAGDGSALRQHVAIGGYAKLAEIASDVLKQNPVSRSLIDALGHNEAAKVVAYQIRQALSPSEYERVAEAQAIYHAQTSTRIAKATTDKVQPLLERLKTLHHSMLELEAQTGGTLTPEQQIQMDTLNYDATTLHAEIQATLGNTIGQLQASAAMVAALEAQPKTLRFAGNDRIQAVADLIPQLWGGEKSETSQAGIFEAFGLTAEDFHLFDSPDGKTLQVKPTGMEKLAVGYNPEDTEAYNRAIAIKRGEFDEDFFVPAGFAYRAKSTFTDATTEAIQFDTRFEALEKLAQPASLFEPAPEVDDGEISASLRSYIGARVANGENPLEVMQDVRSPEFYLQQGLDPYGDSALRVQELASGLVKELAGGDRISDRAIVEAFQSLGDAEAANQRRARQTDDLQALHAQTLDSDSAIEAGHRTLAAMPMARLIFKDKPTPQERKWLRTYAITAVLGQELREPPQKADLQVASEVAEEQFDLFGNRISAAEAIGATSDAPELSQWQEFSKLMGGDEKAYAAVQDHLRGKFLHRFANAYGAIAGKPLLLGGENLAHVDRLLLAKLPERERNEMLEFMRNREQSDVAKVRSRVKGRFATELDAEWLAKYEAIKGDNRQISLLAADTGSSTAKTDVTRSSIGSAAESQLREAMQSVIPNFEQLNSAVDIYPEVNWSAGTAHATKQRALKFLESQKKVGIHFGAGSGKSSIMLGAFTHLHSQNKVKKMIVAVPSSIVGQFVGEAVTFLEPGKYNYNANLGWSREQRLNALTDSDTHIHITTRESLANDLLHLVEKHHGISPEAFRQDPGEGQKGYSEQERQDLIQRSLLAEGIDPKSLMLAVDEAHDITSRKGVDPSKRSLALNALGHHSAYYLQATGDSIKNDLSELHNFLHSVAPDKFNDERKFLAEYGAKTPTSRRALQRAIAPYSFAASTKPQDKSGRTLKMRELQPKIAPSSHQAAERQRILEDTRIVSDYFSRRSNELKEQSVSMLDTEQFNDAWREPEVRAAIDRLASEDTWGKMSDEQKQASIGGQVRAIGALKQTALWRLYHRVPYDQNPKAQHAVQLCKQKIKSDGKAGVVFSSSSQAAEMLRDAMRKEGLRVGLIDGSMNAQQKSAERIKFNPSGQDAAEYDVLVVTDACQTGLNLTRGKFLVHFDVPQTEKAYSQRSARIHRLKQDQDTEIHTPMLDTPEERIAWARMERKGVVAMPLKSKAELIDDSGLAAEIQRLAS